MYFLCCVGQFEVNEDIGVAVVTLTDEDEADRLQVRHSNAFAM